MPPKKNKSPTKPKNSGVNKTLLDNLLETLNTLRNSLGSDEEEEEEENQDLHLPKNENDINGILNALLKIVKQYGEDLQALKSLGIEFQHQYSRGKAQGPGGWVGREPPTQLEG